jgi:hypothetical protein
MIVRVPSRNRRGMLRLAYPGELRATLMDGQTSFDLIDLSQEGARIALGASRHGYQAGAHREIVLSLVSHTILAAQAEVTRVTPNEAAFRFRDLHFPFSVMLDEHCAVLTFQDQAGCYSGSARRSTT